VIAVVLIATVVLAFQAHQKVAHEMTRQKHIDAFDSYMKVVPKFIHDHKPYRSDRFPLPPFAMLFVAPFTLLSRPDAQAAWVLCKPLFFIPIFFLAYSIIKRSSGPIEPAAIALIIAGWFFPVIGDIQEGQMNLLMLLPLALGLWFAQDGKTRNQILAGLFVAMAICIKVTPLAFLAYFLFRRRWLLSAFVVIGSALWLFVVPGFFFGFGQNLLWMHQWTDIMIKPYILQDTIKFPNGESIPELVLRFFSHEPAWKTFSHGHVVWHYVNIASIPPATAHLIGRIILLIIAGAGIIWARRSVPDFHARRYPLEIACIGAFMLWASERTWVPHYVTLIFALMAVGMIASDPLATLRSRTIAWWSLVAVAVLMPFTSELAKIFGHEGRHYTDCADVVIWCSFILVGAILAAKFNPPGAYAVAAGGQDHSNTPAAAAPSRA
jgi:hypothetical protein